MQVLILLQGLHPHFWKSTRQTLRPRLEKPPWGLVPFLLSLYRRCGFLINPNLVWKHSFRWQWAIHINISWSAALEPPQVEHSRALTREKLHYQPHYQAKFLPGSGQNWKHHFSTFFFSFTSLLNSLCPLMHLSLPPPLHTTTPISF